MQNPLFPSSSCPAACHPIPARHLISGPSSHLYLPHAPPPAIIRPTASFTVACHHIPAPSFTAPNHPIRARTLVRLSAACRHPWTRPFPRASSYLAAS
eukprot:205209-Chlamydomonas_euryale.AAC.2